MRTKADEPSPRGQRLFVALLVFAGAFAIFLVLYFIDPKPGFGPAATSGLIPGAYDEGGKQ